MVHPHQRSRAQLPPGHRAGSHAGARTLDRAYSPPRRCDAGRSGPLRRLLHRLRARGRFAAPAPMALLGRRAGSRKGRRNQFPRTGLQRPAPHQSDFRFTYLPLRLSVTGDACFGLRVRRGHRRIHAAQAVGGSRRLRPHPLRKRARSCHCARRRAGSGLAGLSKRQT